MGKRRSSRELGLRFLYQIEFNQEDFDAQIEPFLERCLCQTEVREFMIELVRGVHRHLKDIDALIQKYSEHWTLDRMTLIDRNLLRLGVCEIVYLKNTPPKAAINEAVEIAKKYGSDESPDFINGILDKIYKEMPRPLVRPNVS